MKTDTVATPTERYVRCVAASRRVRWDRWQYIASGVPGRFVAVLMELLTTEQMARVVSALAPILAEATPTGPSSS